MHFRLLTYNIHKCVGGLDRRYDPSRIVQTIAHYSPDIALLQEVGSASDPGAGADQAALLSEGLGYRHRAYVPHTRRWTGGIYGNAILSRFPILEIHHVDLTIPPKKRRGALHVRIRVRLPSGRSRTVHVYNLHLGLSGIERRFQIQRFLASDPFAHLHAHEPIVVGGDFNDVWGTLGRKLLVPAGFRGVEEQLFTFPAFAPVRALDALYVRGDISMAQEKRARLEVARRASDHLPVVAEMTLR